MFWFQIPTEAELRLQMCGTSFSLSPFHHLNLTAERAKSSIYLNPGPAGPRYALPLKTVDPDQSGAAAEVN